ncbi:MAG: hypothetical protein V7K92_00740 [Nostoc sp.]
MDFGLRLLSAYLGFAQLLERLRPKRSYAAGFTTPAPSSGLVLSAAEVAEMLKLNSAQVAQGKSLSRTILDFRLTPAIKSLEKSINARILDNRIILAF